MVVTAALAQMQVQVPAPDGLLAHVDDGGAVEAVLETLRALHGPAYGFALRRWDEYVQVEAARGWVTHWFVIEARAARLKSPHAAELWPGDCLAARARAPLEVTGAGVAPEVRTEATGYLAPPVAHLRDLMDLPRGCAAYEGAFRRQPLPPVASTGPSDLRGVNRVNQHTLDMRSDRTPGPTTHYHAPVPAGDGRVVSHSETAIVLPRAAYGLPETTDELRAVLYRRPAADRCDTVTVPLRVGSILVTPASPARALGHRFENAFAMLIAIPGFVSQTTLVDLS